MDASTSLAALIGYLEKYAPLKLAEDWDNVGLLIGDRRATVSRVMTCLTITPEVVEEAVAGKIEVIVSHHPLPFRPLKKINSDSYTGQMVLQLIQNQIAVYSPHTAFDSCSRGINQMIAEKLSLDDIQVLQDIPDVNGTLTAEDQVCGVGRMGTLPQTLTGRDLCGQLRDHFDLGVIKFSGDLERGVTKVGIACGSAGQFHSQASRLGCDAFITGETNFHTCLESLASGVSLFLLGHYGSERFAVVRLAEELALQFPQVTVQPSQTDRDPIQYVA